MLCLPLYRLDEFPTKDGAVDYYKKVVVETPRVSLGNKSPEPTPTLDQYTSWLVAEHLFDALLNPTAPRPDT